MGWSNKGRQAEKTVHAEAHGAICRLSKLGLESEDTAANGDYCGLPGLVKRTGVSEYAELTSTQ